MLKIAEVLNPKFGKAFGRISNALHEYSKGRIEWVSPQIADLILVHVVGGEELPYLDRYADKLVIMQHCLFTTSVPPQIWENRWAKARLVISYQDFRQYTNKRINMLSTPWGAEPAIFYNDNTRKVVKLFTTGHVASTENIDKCFDACTKTNNVLYHTGENFNWNQNNYRFLPYMSDINYSRLLRQTEYISCLRNIEGFEMAGIEGAFCGARPIVLDLPSYSWYKDFGIYIDPNKDITEQLISIIKEPSKPYTDYEYKMLLDKFSWKTVIDNIVTRIEDAS